MIFVVNHFFADCFHFVHYIWSHLKCVTLLIDLDKILFALEQIKANEVDADFIT